MKVLMPKSSIPESPSRKEYMESESYAGLAKANAAPIFGRDDPFGLFTEWMSDARASEVNDSNAMSLATLDKDGMPDVRIVLLKGFDESGFVFFTNYDSAKGHELQSTPKAAILFPWLDLERQVRISGCVETISEAESTQYFHSRPRGSQLGAWVSAQSQVIANREVLSHSMQTIETRFKDQQIPLPESWGGYRIKPETYEFWQGRANRLHDRFQYNRKDDGWQVDRLAP